MKAMTDTPSSRRAPKGGTTGLNGERYKGGTFLPTTTLPKQGSQGKKVKTSTEEVAPYDWQPQPQPEARALFGKFRALVKWGADGQPGELLTEVLDYKKYTPEERAQVSKARDLWLAGQRWYMPEDL